MEILFLETRIKVEYRSGLNSRLPILGCDISLPHDGRKKRNIKLPLYFNSVYEASSRGALDQFAAYIRRNSLRRVYINKSFTPPSHARETGRRARKTRKKIALVLTLAP